MKKHTKKSISLILVFIFALAQSALSPAAAHAALAPVSQNTETAQPSTPVTTASASPSPAPTSYPQSTVPESAISSPTPVDDPNTLADAKKIIASSKFGAGKVIVESEPLNCIKPPCPSQLTAKVQVPVYENGILKTATIATYKITKYLSSYTGITVTTQDGQTITFNVGGDYNIRSKVQSDNLGTLERYEAGYLKQVTDAAGIKQYKMLSHYLTLTSVSSTGVRSVAQSYYHEFDAAGNVKRTQSYRQWPSGDSVYLDINPAQNSYICRLYKNYALTGSFYFTEKPRIVAETSGLQLYITGKTKDGYVKIDMTGKTFVVTKVTFPVIRTPLSLHITKITDRWGSNTVLRQFDAVSFQLDDPFGVSWKLRQNNYDSFYLTDQFGAVSKLQVLDINKIKITDTWGAPSTLEQVSADSFQATDQFGQTSIIKPVSADTIVVTDKWGNSATVKRISYNTYTLTDSWGDTSKIEEVSSDTVKITDSRGNVSISTRVGPVGSNSTLASIFCLTGDALWSQMIEIYANAVWKPY